MDKKIIRADLFTELAQTFKKKYGEDVYERLRGSMVTIFCMIYSGNLSMLARLCRTDKYGSHWYARHYEKFFKKIRRNKLNLLEIGVGGFEDPRAGGNSLRMWKSYFPKSMIYSIDIYDKKFLEEKRIEIFRGSQDDENFLKDVYNRIGSLDIIIDDGSHINKHVITSFKTLFPLLNDNGIYAVEDVESSYWPLCGGDARNFNNPETIMGYFKSLLDGLNHVHYKKSGSELSYFEKNITEMHFYHNLVIIRKGLNNELGECFA